MRSADLVGCAGGAADRGQTVLTSTGRVRVEGGWGIGRRAASVLRRAHFRRRNEAPLRLRGPHRHVPADLGGSTPSEPRALTQGGLRGGDDALMVRRPGRARSARVVSTYERAAARYDRVWRRLWLRVAGGAAETAMLGAALDAVSAMDGPRVLDAGAGTGALSRRLTLEQFGLRPVLVDLSPGMLARAADLQLPRALASVQALPFADGTFDLVVSAWVIETVDSPRAAVTEMLRVLRPGGALVYSFCSRPVSRLDRLRSGPTRAVVHALFAGHFLGEKQTPFHDCDVSRRSSFAGGAATVIVLGKCCTVETAKAAGTAMAWPATAR